MIIERGNRMKKLIKFLFSRMFIVGMLILFQILILFTGILKLGEYFVYLYVILSGISLLTVLYILNKKDNPSYKLAWAIPILLFPIFGGLFYLFVGGDKAGKKFKKHFNRRVKQSQEFQIQDASILAEIKSQKKSIATQSKYILGASGCPIYKNTITKYLSPGEDYFEVLIEELKLAKHYIFMEYFIVEEGIMWNTILDILAQKVKEGVDVRVMYDDAGTIQTLPYKYHEQIKKLGIKVAVFNEIKAKLSLKFNNRDHRKITVIDGYIGFTGGVNIADEYINQIVKFGHWKDAGIMLKGDAVYNLTIMFLQAWNYSTNQTEDYAAFEPHRYHPGCFESDGYVQPYGDSPLDDEIVGENVYLNILHKATDYVYINTPYLIVDNELVTAMTLAAKSGVDIRIVTPHIEDKWYVHILTRAYYPQLIEAGVKIYEYTPGFMHSKTFVADDEIGVVGTINLDYRSLYLHFECAVWLYNTKSVKEIKDDFLTTLEQCLPVTLEECHKVKWYVKFMRSILRVLAPLM